MAKDTDNNDKNSQDQINPVQSTKYPQDPRMAEIQPPMPQKKAYDPSKQPKKQIELLKDKINVAVYGMGSQLDDENNAISKIISRTSSDVISKFGKRAYDNDIVGAFSNGGISTVLNSLTTKSGTGKTGEDTYRDILENNSEYANTILGANSSKLIDYDNFEQMAKYIPECSFGLEVYVSNILSPDDFSKMIFDVKYSDSSINNGDGSSIVQGNLNKLIKRYDIETKADTYIRQTLTYGDCYVAILPYNHEIAKMINSLSSGSNGMITESYIKENAGKDNITLLENDFHIVEGTTSTTLDEDSDKEILVNDEDYAALESLFGSTKALAESKTALDRKSLIDNAFNAMINENIHLKPITDLLVERAEGDMDMSNSAFGVLNSVGLDLDYKKVNNDRAGQINKNKNPQKKLLSNISGSVMRMLDPKKIVEISADGICYGYYYVEPGSDVGSPENPVGYSISKINNQNSNPMNPSLSNYSVPGADPGEGQSPVARNLHISDEKLHLISGLVLKGLSKKLNKKFIENNKKFKDIIYGLLRQEYLLRKGVNITFFMPDEVVHFEAQSIYENIVFFAKLYLATLVNTILVKLGRSHDKRIYYVQEGLDSNYEQSIQKAIESVKTREFKMSNMSTVTDILNLNPAQFEDIYIPKAANGQVPIELGTLPGMDQDIKNDFMDYLKKSMVNGMGLPQAILDEEDNMNVARQVATQNEHFLRRVIVYQKKLTKPFSDMIRLLYKNEYLITSDSTNYSDDAKINIDKIYINFPAPGTLRRSSLIEQITTTDTYAQAIAQTYFPVTQNGKYDDAMNRLKGKIIKQELSQLDWNGYDKLYDEVQKEMKNEEMKSDISNSEDQMNANQQGGFAGPQEPDQNGNMGQDGQY